MYLIKTDLLRCCSPCLFGLSPGKQGLILLRVLAIDLDGSTYEKENEGKKKEETLWSDKFSVYEQTCQMFGETAIDCKGIGILS